MLRVLGGGLLCLPLACSGKNEGGEIGGPREALAALSSVVSVSGRVSKGPVAGATVEALELKADNSLGALLAATTSNASGDFNLSLPGSVRVLVQARGGSYTDEATGATVMFAPGEVSFSALLDQPRTAPRIALTPLTTIAVDRALALMRAGTSQSAAIARATGEISNYFGLPDVVVNQPADANTRMREDDPASDYAAVLVAFSEQARLLSASTFRSISALDLTRALGEDLRDGVQNGMNASAAVIIGVSSVTLGTNVVTTGTANALRSFFVASNPRNVTGFDQAQVAPLVSLLESAGSILFAPPATPSPRLRIMDASTGSQTNSASGDLRVITGDDVEGQAWLVAEGVTTAPAASNPRFAAEPRRLRLSAGNGLKTVYAWVRNAAGVVSSVAVSRDIILGGAPLPPVIAGLGPSFGPVEGGNTVTILGSDLAIGAMPNPAVTFGGLAATVVSASYGRVDVIVPPAATGGAMTVALTLASFPTATSTYTYDAAPVLTKIYFDYGPLAGNTAVRITGRRFASFSGGTPIVAVGGLGLSSVVVVDDTTITAVTPSGAGPGPAALTITNTNGSAALSPGFTYQPLPTITGLDPDQGPLAGGIAVTLKGSGFATPGAGSNILRIDGATVPLIRSTTDGAIVFTLPPHATAGLVDVELVNANGRAFKAAAFRYGGLEIASVEPARGHISGGTAVTLRGTGFTIPAGTGPALSVTFAGQLATAVTVLSDTQLTCRTPPGVAGLVDVRVSVGTQADTLPLGFRYFAVHQIESVNPNSGALAGGTAITITGFGFQAGVPGATSVLIGGTPATSVVVASDSSITAVTPAGVAQGPTSVVVTNANGGAVLMNGYTYLPPPTYSLAFSLATSSVTEDTLKRVRGVSVKLVSSDSSNLPSAASVTVQNALTGTATSGVDYTAIAPTVLNFPAGSVDGFEVAFNIEILPDLLLEASERIDLTLSTPTGVATLGATVAHSLTIADNDAVISGRITFEKWIATTAGLNVNAPSVTMPVRFADVDLVEASAGFTALRTATNNSGDYQFIYDQSSAQHFVRVKTCSDQTAFLNFDVVYKNGGQDCRYAFQTTPFTINAAAITRNLHQAASLTTSPRLIAGAFNIFDVVVKAHELALPAQPALPATVKLATNDLRVRWFLGDPTGSFYQHPTKELFLRGGQAGVESSTNTDMYDDAVIGHEVGHYLHRVLSVSASSGGAHAFGDRLVPSLAYGEGFASYLGCLAGASTLYLNSTGFGPASPGAWGFNLETSQQFVGGVSTPTANLGATNEISVSAILWDLSDGGAGAPASADGDVLALSATAVLQPALSYNVLTDYPALNLHLQRLVAAGGVTNAQLTALMFAPTNHGIVWLPVAYPVDFPIPLTVNGPAIVGSANGTTGIAGLGTNFRGTHPATIVHTFSVAATVQHTITLTITSPAPGGANNLNLLLTLNTAGGPQTMNLSATNNAVEQIIQNLPPGLYGVEVQAVATQGNYTLQVTSP